MPGCPTFTPMPPRMFLMILCSKVSSSSSCACWADAATGKVSRMPQRQAKNARRRLVDGSFGITIIRLRPKCAVSRAAASGPSGPTPSFPGIGALLRRAPEEGFIQESDHPRNDSGIRKVKHVPGEIEARRGDVEQHEIRHRPVGQPVDRVTECATD